MTTDGNRFRWPGPDVRVLDDGTSFYGAIPDWLFLRVRARVGTWAGRGMRVVGRTEFFSEYVSLSKKGEHPLADALGEFILDIAYCSTPPIPGPDLYQARRRFDAETIRYFALDI